MSKSSTGTVPQNTKLPGTSAWSKGPPTSSQSSRSQSPAPSQFQPSHSRRPSAALQSIPIKDGVSIPRGNVGAAKQASPVTFGSIDDAAASAPISSSPATAPASAVKADVKSFGSVDAIPSSGTPRPGHVNGKGSISQKPASSTSSTPAASTPPPSDNPKPKIDVKAFFRSNAGGATPSPTPSPSVRPSTLPPQTQSQHGPNASSFQPFVPSRGRGPNNVPPSPGFRGNQQMNGNRPPPQAGGPPPPGGPPPMNAMASPRMPPQHLPGQPVPGMQPAPMQGWYYPPYPGYVDPNWAAYAGQWYQMPPPGQPPMSPQQHPVQPPIPMSPRNPPPPLQAGPGTPAPVHASPVPHPPPTHAPSNSINGVVSPPGTPASATVPVPAARLNQGAPPFTPSARKVTLRTPDGNELKFDKYKSNGQQPPTPATPTAVTSPRKPIKIEKPTEAHEKRIAAEKAEAEAKAKKEREEKEKEEKERKEKEEADRKKAAEEERVRKESEEKARKEAEEKSKLEEEERAKEEERKKVEEAERLQKEEEERVAQEAERKKAEEPAAQPEETKEDVEEGEIKEAPVDAPAAADEKEDPSKVKFPSIGVDPQRKRPGPLNIAITNRSLIEPPLPSALATARIIDDIGSVNYPEGIKSPQVELNVHAKDGKFRYDRDFLLQFMEVCKEKPDRLPPLDAIGLEPVGPADFAMSRGGSHRKPSNAQAPSRPASGLGGPGGAFGGKPGGGSAFGGMGNFQTPGSKLTSQERFERANSITSSPTMGFARPSAITRSASQGGPGAADNKRTRSQRGNKRGDRQDGGGGGGGGKFNGPPPGHSAFGHNANNLMNLEPVAPLQKSENRWDPRTRPPTNEPDSPEVVDRKVKGLLNKLTMEKFDSLSDQIIAWANKSEKEKDGRTLIQVIRLVFEKATDEAAWSEMYARLCRKMMEQISPKVQDDGIKNAEGKPITGGQLFRKYLLNRCQEDFERGWVNKEATAAAAATKAVEDKAVQAANANKEGGDNAQEPDLYSEEYYAAQKAKRQGLGLIRFIGELFKLQMLTERIMHQCVQKLLGNVENPEEEEIESLAKLLTTVGELLDTPRAHAHMDVYFARMKELTKKPSVNSRMQFMLQDLVELRERGWRGRTASAGPATIAQIHELAAKEKAAQEKETMHRQSTMSRGGSRRGGERRDSEHVGPDGWTVAGSAPRPPAKAGDLSKFGSISKPTQMTFGPSSVFAGKKDKRESLSRAASTSNMFHALQSEGAEPVTAPKSSRPPSRKPSVDLTAAGAEGLPQRRKLVLQPRTKPLEENKPDGSDSEEEEEGSTAAAPAAEMTDEAAKKKVGEDIKEFFAIRNMEEAENYFTTLPAPHHHLLVDKLVGQALESKEADVKLVADLFAHALSKDLVSHDALEEGMAPTMEFLEDIAIDVPKAWDFMALLVKAASFDEERRTRLVEKSSGADKLLALLS